MSFLNKITKEFDDLKSTFSKGDGTKEQMHEETHYGQSSQHGEQAQQYGQSSYGQGPHYGGAPAPGLTNVDSSLPPGWIKQWDSTSQRWYFVQQATGRTQWEPPVLIAQSYGEQNTYPSTGGHYEQHHDSTMKAKGHSTMGAAAGGLAGDDSDSDHEHGAGHYAPQLSGCNQQPMQQQPYQAGDPSLPSQEDELPDETRSGSSVSGSDKEDVEEAREEYREALEEGDDSDIEEAREEYEEEFEETYND
ncbi:hypothetical protein EPUS_01594 [Endocarpon pusillum Z07020]|uniref:WW domain-containing protein n=1 Tax=Endocarpon pusillum (strain Z07020 / HMAS-L-300199) TaxID=1263415 RepID=U1I1H4_ENDPU|nr:uncharacterized protein EPUS_01594 [Endocarpon pusillum Z07020]ERF75764.1 hypothetical protein EPUS_01594 [Endocarpon pusillum Z07020]